MYFNFELSNSIKQKYILKDKVYRILILIRYFCSYTTKSQEATSFMEHFIQSIQ